MTGLIVDEDMVEFVSGLPKAELHVHLEGTIAPEMMMVLAARNQHPVPWKTAAEFEAELHFSGLKSFLALYFEGCQVLLRRDRDFYDVALAYLQRAHADGVRRAEVFVGPQSFTDRGVPLAAILDGVLQAFQDAGRMLGISAGLIVSAQRHRTENDALALLRAVSPWSDQIAGFGMGGPELGNPPSKFARFFEACQSEGFRTTIHAGEEGPSSYVREAVDLLGVQRIDHGNACLDDPALVRDLAVRGIPLTVCPLSNLMLNAVDSLATHPLSAMLAAGLLVTVNSDDPAYFGGYIAENFLQIQRGLALTPEELILLARNSFMAAWIAPEARVAALEAVDAYEARGRLVSGDERRS